MLLNNIYIKSISIAVFLVNFAFAGEIVDDTLQAIKLDDVAGVTEGLQRGLDVNFVDVDGNSLLMLAARDGSTRASAILINAGAKTYLRNAYGDDALMLATFSGYGAVVDLLLAKHASVGANMRGWTPLHYAAYAGHLPLITKFLALGAKVNSQTDNGLSPLMLAAKNGHIDVVRALLASKADTEMFDENKLSAFDHAMANANTNIAALIKPPAINSPK